MTAALRLLASLVLVAAEAAAAAIPLEHFAKLPEFNDIVLSPDGRYVAAGVPDGNQTNLAVIRLADMKVTAAIRAGMDFHVARMWWASPERVVVALANSSGPLERPFLTGEIMAVDADGTDVSYLFGHNPPGRVSRLGSEVTAGYAEVVSTLKHDRDHILVASIHGREAWLDTAIAMLYRLNIRTARTSAIAQAPIEGFAAFVVDDAGKPRFAFAEDKKTLATRTFRYTTDGGRWKEIGSGRKGAELLPLRVAADGEAVFLSARDGTDRACLAELATGGTEIRRLSCNAAADLEGAIFSTDGRVPLAAIYQPDRIVIDWLNPEHAEAVALRKLSDAFPGQAVLPTSRTEDGAKYIITAFSDRNPGDYYLYDAKAGKAQYLFSSRGWIDPEQMAERRPIRFRSRDGATIHGYLTLPRGVEEKKLPLIVHPHGGPFGVRDEWAWEADPQMLASRGYAVFQVNYRGSGGYGNTHHEAARGKWGTMMIDDITDGARWTVEQGIADPERMCIYGGSYGGYASLMSAVREPDLYKCAVGYVGVYDLRSWMSDTDVNDWKAGRNYMRQYVGDDPETLKAQSPLQQLDRLKAPVFIVHGKRDERVPYSQATQLRDALDKRKHPYEWLVKSDEAHGFYRVEARVELYERLLAFFDEHIGAK
jgi:acetyl esterase/lipase